MPESDPRLALVERFFRGTGGTYDAVVNLATFGIDRLWSGASSPNPAGPGGFWTSLRHWNIHVAIARRFPNSRIVGVELREEYLALARQKVRRHRMHNVELVLSRAEDYRSTSPSMHLVHVSRQVRGSPAACAQLQRMLKKGGLLLMHDFTFPPNPALTGALAALLKTLQTLGGACSPLSRDLLRPAAASSRKTRWLPEKQHAGRERLRRCAHAVPYRYGSAIVSARR